LLAIKLEDVIRNRAKEKQGERTDLTSSRILEKVNDPIYM